MSVYFARVGHYIKVGFSRNPERRVRRLFSSATPAPDDCPRDVASRRLLRVIDGDLSVERAALAALDDFHALGEFFVDEPEVREFIATVEAARSYPQVERPAGPYAPPSRIAPEQQAHLNSVLAGLFERRAS